MPFPEKKSEPKAEPKKESAPKLKTVTSNDVGEQTKTKKG